MFLLGWTVDAAIKKFYCKTKELSWHKKMVSETRRWFEIGLTQLNIRSNVEESGRPGGVEGREEIWVTGDFLLTCRRNIKTWFFYFARASYSNSMCFKDNLTIKWNKGGKYRG